MVRMIQCFYRWIYPQLCKRLPEGLHRFDVFFCSGRVSNDGFCALTKTCFFNMFAFSGILAQQIPFFFPSKPCTDIASQTCFGHLLNRNYLVHSSMSCDKFKYISCLCILLNAYSEMTNQRSQQTYHCVQKWLILGNDPLKRGCKKDD